MQYRERIDRTGSLVGVAAAATVMAALMICVGLLVVRFCPGGEDCEETSRKLYWLGVLVSLTISGAVGFLVRDFVNRSRKKQAS